MTLAILELLEQNETLNASVIDAFIEANGSPIVEGPTITFLFRGRVDEVRLRHFVFGLPTSQRFHHIGGTDLWYLSMEVPRGVTHRIQAGARSARRDAARPRPAEQEAVARSVRRELAAGSGFLRGR